MRRLPPALLPTVAAAAVSAVLAFAVPAATATTTTPTVSAAIAPGAGPVSLTVAPAKGGAPVDNTQVLYDTYAQRLDAHDGDLLQAPDGTIYLYGTAYGCGFTLNAASPFCGVRIYATHDLRTFTPAGAVGGQYAFDHLAGDWQTICAPPGNFGCYRPHVVRRPADGKYVMWINTHQAGGYRVLLADKPTGPFLDTGITPDLAVKPPVGGLRYGDMDLTVDPADRSVYITYTAIWPTTNAHDIVVEKLDPTGTTGTGTHTVLDTAPGTTDIVEAPALFKAPTGTWHMAYSNPAKPYLTTGTGIMNAPNPLGPWTAPRTLAFNSCNGQPAGVWPIVGPSGKTAWVYGSDRWENGNANQAKSNNYYGQLTFTANRGTAIDGYTCQAGWTLR